MITIEGKINSAKVFTDTCDQATVAQVTNLLNQSCVQGSQIRIMPDCHAGAGCVIGTTTTIQDSIHYRLIQGPNIAFLLSLKQHSHYEIQRYDRPALIICCSVHLLMRLL